LAVQTQKILHLFSNCCSERLLRWKLLDLLLLPLLLLLLSHLLLLLLLLLLLGLLLLLLPLVVGVRALPLLLLPLLPLLLLLLHLLLLLLLLPLRLEPATCVPDAADTRPNVDGRHQKLDDNQGNQASWTIQLAVIELSSTLVAPTPPTPPPPRPHSHCLPLDEPTTLDLASTQQHDRRYV